MTKLTRIAVSNRQGYPAPRVQWLAVLIGSALPVGECTALFRPEISHNDQHFERGVLVASTSGASPFWHPMCLSG